MQHFIHHYYDNISISFFAHKLCHTRLEIYHSSIYLPSITQYLNLFLVSSHSHLARYLHRRASPRSSMRTSSCFMFAFRFCLRLLLLSLLLLLWLLLFLFSLLLLLLMSISTFSITAHRFFFAFSFCRLPFAGHVSLPVSC